MKKIALTSLLAVMAASGAHAANVIDGNPLYMPEQCHFYSETSLETHTRNTDVVSLGEEFGYGITNRLAVALHTSITEDDWLKEFEWNELGLGLTYRIADLAHWKLDVLGGYAVGPVWDAHDGLSHGRFLKRKDTEYVWTVGMRGGYTTGDFTLAGHVLMEYENTESFNWDENQWGPDGVSGLHMLHAGLDAQLVLNEHWNLVSGADYMKLLDHYNEFATSGAWELTFGANYNIDETKYVGAYITKDVLHTHATADGDWEFQDGFGMGIKFGVDF